MSRIFFVLFVVFTMTGCITTKVTNSAVEPGTTTDTITFHKWDGTGLAVVKPECPNGVSNISRGRTIGQAFMSSITLGFYFPSTVRITCAK
ncbi:MAG: hypothetical protein NTV34_20820 [Proteobacteria bacterium]|nr:hypothetical protein [Pseudomonadota bacterium]